MGRRKAKAKRFGEAPSPREYGAGVAFGSRADAAISAGSAAPLPEKLGSRAAGKRELLVVDGYNVIHATPRYERLVYTSSDDPLSNDVYPRAREALLSDVAAFAQASYDAVVVFDGAGNKNPERPDLPVAGVRVMFSPPGVSADRVIEQLCTDARKQGRACTVATSDGTVQAVAMGRGVTRISARILTQEIREVDEAVHREMDDAAPMRLTMADRLSPEMREKLDRLRGRRS